MKNSIEAYICATIGLNLIGIAAWKIIRTVIFLRLARTAIGTVIGYRTGRGSDSQIMYLPVVEFALAAADNKIQITSTIGSNPPARKIGDSVTVRYLPKNPRAGRVQSFWEMWAYPAIFLVAALLLFALAYLIFND